MKSEEKYFLANFTSIVKFWHYCCWKCNGGLLLTKVSCSLKLFFVKAMRNLLKLTFTEVKKNKNAIIPLQTVHLAIKLLPLLHRSKSNKLLNGYKCFTKCRFQHSIFCFLFSEEKCNLEELPLIQFHSVIQFYAFQKLLVWKKENEMRKKKMKRIFKAISLMVGSSKRNNENFCRMRTSNWEKFAKVNKILFFKWTAQEFFI